MKNNYLCPRCRSYLNVENFVVFTIVSKKGHTGLILLHPELGNYSASYNPDFELQEGEVFEFRCPVCHAYLQSDFDERLAEIIMMDEHDNQFRVIFSKIKGDKSTFTLQGESVQFYGQDYKKYIDFVTLSQLT